ncbi:hypothetical protein EYF80_000016 [Liparis tanakae]|uniref:Uncharacterized protein n=1 Tax=Liparis tanakae TaxID=230148 RepID=A0A4Z2JHY1_9TELE|nr:hypothetical protein EYF80_000016 [Liparis tanakae]
MAGVIRAVSQALATGQRRRAPSGPNQCWGPRERAFKRPSSAAALPCSEACGKTQPGQPPVSGPRGAWAVWELTQSARAGGGPPETRATAQLTWLGRADGASRAVG